MITEEEPPKTVEVGWQRIEELCSYIAGFAKVMHYDALIGIGRGGLIPATILSHKLDLPLMPIMWQTRDILSCHTEDLENALHSYHWNEDDEKSRTFLFVDDINDSGKTIQQIASYTREVLSEHWPNYRYDFAVLFERKSSKTNADIVGESLRTQDWIEFPWER